MRSTGFSSFFLLLLLGARADETSCHVDGCDDGPRVAFLIMVHNGDTLEACHKLLDALYHKDHTFLIHFDRKMDISEYEFEWRRMSHGRSENVKKFSFHDVKWGGWDMLTPWFSAASMLLKQKTRQWDIFINLSGDSYPVLKPEALRKRLKEIGHMNFVTGSSSVTGLRPTKWSEFDPTWHKRKAFPFPIVEDTTREAYYGSQWMVLTRAFVEYVMETLDNQDTFVGKLADWFQHGTLEVDTGRQVMKVRPHIPDEIFFPTILMESSFNATVPDYRLEGMRAMHYIRLDEHYPWSNHKQRYQSPNENNMRSWGPYYLGVYDFGNIKRSGALFIRKVSMKVDPNVYSLLPVSSHDDIPEVHWPVSKDELGNDHKIQILPGAKTGQVDANGCVAVAESIHCPPKHILDPEIVKKYDLPILAGG